VDKNIIDTVVEISLNNIVRRKGGPFGAVIVDSGTNEIISYGANSVTTDKDPTAHAEVNAIRKACESLGTFSLTGKTLYTSCEPCPMCLGAIYWSNLDKVFYANTKTDAAEIGFDDSFIYDEINKEKSERKIKFVQIECKEAKEVFKIWKNDKDKVEY